MSTYYKEVLQKSDFFQMSITLVLTFTVKTETLSKGKNETLNINKSYLARQYTFQKSHWRTNYTFLVINDQSIIGNSTISLNKTKMVEVKLQA